MTTAKFCSFHQTYVNNPLPTTRVTTDVPDDRASRADPRGVPGNPRELLLLARRVGGGDAGG